MPLSDEWLVLDGFYFAPVKVPQRGYELLIVRRGFSSHLDDGSVSLPMIASRTHTAKDVLRLEVEYHQPRAEAMRMAAPKNTERDWKGEESNMMG